MTDLPVQDTDIGGYNLRKGHSLPQQWSFKAKEGDSFMICRIKCVKFFTCGILPEFADALVKNMI
jgi:hypothetical protein